MDPELKPNTNFILEPGIYYCNQKINVNVPGIKFMPKPKESTDLDTNNQPVDSNIFNH